MGVSDAPASRSTSLLTMANKKLADKPHISTPGDAFHWSQGPPRLRENDISNRCRITIATLPSGRKAIRSPHRGRKYFVHEFIDNLYGNPNECGPQAFG